MIEIETVALFLTNKFIQRKIISPDKKAIYKSGLLLILSDIINFSLVFIVGMLTKTFVYSILYLLMLWGIRRFSGGFHAKTYSVCRMVTVGMYVLVIYLNSILKSERLIYSVVFCVISIFTMLLLAPIKHPNKDLTVREMKFNKIMSLVSTSFFSVLAIAFSASERSMGFVMSLILLAISILMYVGIAVNRKGEK